MDLAKGYPPDDGGQGSRFKCMRAHVHKMLHADLQIHVDLRTRIVEEAKSVAEVDSVLSDLTIFHQEENHDVTKEELSWYVRHQVKRSCSCSCSGGPTESCKALEEIQDYKSCHFRSDDDGPGVFGKPLSLHRHVSN